MTEMAKNRIDKFKTISSSTEAKNMQVNYHNALKLTFISFFDITKSS